MFRHNIKVFGIGGGGSNTVDYLVDKGTINVQTYAINTDAQALKNSKADKKIHIGEVSTKGLGAGALPEIGKKAAEESKEKLIQELKGADIVLIASGLGGGTGTGAAPYIAGLAKELDILTIGVVTKPFHFEGPSRMKMALEGLEKMDENTDVTIVIPNENLIASHKDKYMDDAFLIPDSVLKVAIDAITLILENTSDVGPNIDLNTIRSLLLNSGLAVMGIGASNNDDFSGEENVISALEEALRSEILEVSIHGARNFVVLLSANPEYVSMADFDLPGNYLTNLVGYEIKCITSFEVDTSLGEKERKITVIASGYENKEFVGQIKEMEKKTKFSSDIFTGI